MSGYPALSPQVIGQAEKTLNAILDRLLPGTGLTEPLWVTLTLTAASDGTLSRDQLAARVAGAVAVSETEAHARIAKLADARLLEVPAGKPVRLTGAGRQLHGQIRAAVTQVTQRLWADLPAGDLAIAGRVLSIITARATAELADDSVKYLTTK